MDSGSDANVESVADSGNAADSSGTADSLSTADVVSFGDAAAVESGAQDAAGVDVAAIPEGGADTATNPDAAEAGEAAAPSNLVVVPLSGCIPYYTADVMVGDGSDSFALIVDTGSTTLAVASSSCTNCTGVTPLYTPGPSAVDKHQSTSSTYAGDAMWAGEIYSDTVSMGIPTASASVLLAAIDNQNQFFLGSIMCGPSSTTYASQGIVGFAPGLDAVMGTDGFFDQFVGGSSVQNIFAIELCDTGGTLWLGGYDPTAAPAYTPLITTGIGEGLYAVNLEQVSIPGTTAAVPTGNYTASIVDTGTSLFVLPPQAFTTITEAIAASTEFQTIFGRAAAAFFNNPNNCVNLSQTQAQLDAALPAMTLVYGTNPAISVTATATESYLVSYSPGEWCPTLESNAPSASTPIASIIGSPMLRSSVVIFDRAAKRIGFAPHAPCP
jgi:hypothetical protein